MEMTDSFIADCGFSVGLKEYVRWFGSFSHKYDLRSRRLQQKYYSATVSISCHRCLGETSEIFKRFFSIGVHDQNILGASDGMKDGARRLLLQRFLNKRTPRLTSQNEKYTADKIVSYYIHIYGYVIKLIHSVVSNKAALLNLLFRTDSTDKNRRKRQDLRSRGLIHRARRLIFGIMTLGSFCASIRIYELKRFVQARLAFFTTPQQCLTVC